MIAQTILNQMGGSKFVAMTGAKYLIDLGNGLQFKLPRIRGCKVNSVRIVLNHANTYDVEFGCVGRCGYAVIKSANGVYADQLQQLFTRTTGLDTHL